MDSPVIAQLFRQLFRHKACQSIRPQAVHSLRTAHGFQQRRSIGTGKKPRRYGDVFERKNDGTWRHRVDEYPGDMADALRKCPRVTATQLRSRTERPTKVSMSTRDFIEDSLYNPNYGYFSKNATIFTPGDPFNFNEIDDGPEFNRTLDQRYVEFEDALDEKQPDELRQLWHTPTELFQPYYGEAIARYLVANYKLTQYPYHDLIIYEMGAGNGTLMLNILDHIRESDPEVYQRTKYKIIEISPALAAKQKNNLRRSPHAASHFHHAEIVNKSVFEWDQYVNSPCFFLALEVFDNFGHDAIAYDAVTEEALQGNVMIDEHGDFYSYYTKELDPLASRYLRVRDAASTSNLLTPLGPSRLLRRIRQSLPYAPNLTEPEYIPTKALAFFDVLREYFPAHRLLMSDFDALPDAVPGMNAPVVQTRYQRRNVQVTTPYVHQGYFDIFFPTDFRIMEDIYSAVTGKLTRVITHEEFLQSWAYLEETQTRNGENPLLSWYKNAKVFTTV